MGQRDQHRQRVDRRCVRGVGRRVVPAVHVALWTGPADGSSPGDGPGIDGEPAGAPHLGPGQPSEIEQRQSHRPVGMAEDRCGHTATAREAVDRDLRSGHRGQLSTRDPEHRQALLSAAVHGAQQLIMVEDRVRRLPELPLRKAELGVEFVQRPDRTVAPQIEVPPVGAVGDEDQLLAEPARHDRGFSRTSRDLGHLAQPAVGERAHLDHGRIPRHIGVVPLGPGQPVAAGQLGGGVEVRARAEHDSAVGILPIEVERDDRVHRLTVTVLLADGQHQATTEMQPQIAVAKAPGRGDRHRRRAVPQPIDPAVGELRIHDHAVVDIELAAAVLMHPVPDVRGLRGHLGRLTARDGPPPHAAATTLIGSGLQPVQLVAVDSHRCQAGRRGGQVFDREWRSP